MDYIASGLFKHLSNECYRWEENERAKKFECLILSRFFVTYALNHVKGMGEEKKQFYRNMTNMVFDENLKSEFPWLDAPDIIKDKLDTYSEIMADVSPPLCWQVLAGACTEIDYYSRQDQPTLKASSMVLPALLLFARNFWEKFT